MLTSSLGLLHADGFKSASQSDFADDRHIRELELRFKTALYLAVTAYLVFKSAAAMEEELCTRSPIGARGPHMLGVQSAFDCLDVLLWYLEAMILLVAKLSAKLLCTMAGMVVLP